MLSVHQRTPTNDSLNERVRGGELLRYRPLMRFLEMQCVRVCVPPQLLVSYGLELSKQRAPRIAVVRASQGLQNRRAACVCLTERREGDTSERVGQSRASSRRQYIYVFFGSTNRAAYFLSLPLDTCCLVYPIATAFRAGRVTPG